MSPSKFNKLILIQRQIDATRKRIEELMESYTSPKKKHNDIREFISYLDGIWRKTK